MQLIGDLHRLGGVVMSSFTKCPNMHEGQYLRVYERDTDALFLRLLRESAGALHVLAAGLPLSQSPNRAPVVRGQVRHVGQAGSIDIEVEIEDGPVLLVENKIDAAYSTTRDGHGQPQRYRASVETRRRAGREAHAILLAPERYIAGSRLADLFDARVPYEAFMGLVDGSDRLLLCAAIRQAETPYEPAANDRTGDFFVAMRRLIARHFPDLVMKHDPNADGVRPDASRTVYFDVARTLRLHRGVPRPRMSLQCWDSAARSASVKIMLPDRACLATALAVPRDLADIGGYLRPAGRSLGIVIDTPRLDTQRPFDEQADDIVEALQGAVRLQAWWDDNSDTLRTWAMDRNDRGVQPV